MLLSRQLLNSGSNMARIQNAYLLGRPEGRGRERIFAQNEVTILRMQSGIYKECEFHNCQER